MSVFDCARSREAAPPATVAMPVARLRAPAPLTGATCSGPNYYYECAGIWAA